MTAFRPPYSDAIIFFRQLVMSPVSSDEEEFFDIFQEPSRPDSPQPSVTYFHRNPDHVQFGPLDFIVNLPAKHSLWAHEMWNAGRSMALYLDSHKDLYVNKCILELGAGASLPSIICAINGASSVTSTDYPEKPLLDNILKNAEANAPQQVLDKTFRVQGYLWGQDEQLLDEPLTLNGKFDVILMADLIFNHSQHENILKTCQQVLKQSGIIIKTFSHNVVKWADRDMKFFELATAMGFKHEHLYDEKWNPMFPNDPGDVEVRSTVHGYILKFA